ncbi:MAG: PQQ-binding-like beta-propeller repeat protein, partial [Akkermansiaceae bacterium]|nr:PQQ-binding-like beta-propeller repeat protein [Akkermansiaceae bacterium]
MGRPVAWLAAVLAGALSACERQPAAKAPVPAPPPPAPWDSAWPMTRGEPTLSGRVRAPAPVAPTIEWTYRAGTAITSEAAIADGLIVVGDDNGGIHAVDLATRTLRWRITTGDTVEAAPAITAGKVLVGSKNGVFRALDAANGQLRWSHEGDDKFPTGATLAADGQWVLANGYDGITRCWRATDGTEVWRHDTGDYINGSPALLNDGRIVFGGCDARLHILALTDGTATTGYESAAHIVRSLAAWDTAVYGVNH